MTGYTPHTLCVMRDAFDQAWALVQCTYSDPQVREAAHMRLAGAIVDVSPRTGAKVDTVRRMALDLFRILDRDEPPLV